MAIATVAINSDPPTELIDTMVGSAQIVAATVTLENELPEEHISIWLPVDDRGDIQRSVERSRPDAVVSVVTNDADGLSSCSTDERANPFSVAAAVAVIKRSWGWDESDPIDISVNGTSVPVHAQRDGRVWSVTRA